MLQEQTDHHGAGGLLGAFQVLKWLAWPAWPDWLRSRLEALLRKSAYMNRHKDLEKIAEADREGKYKA